MTTRPRLRTLTPVVLLAIVGGCRGDNAPPTAATRAPPSSASFSEGGSFGAERNVGNGRPHVEDIRASAVFTHLKGRFRECVGANGGLYTETDHTFTGTSQGEPRLTGAIEMRVEDLVENATFAGPQTGRLIIRDANGKEKFRGDYEAWGHSGGDYVQGTVASGFRKEEGRLVAGWTVIYAPDGLFGEFGGTPRSNQVPAGIYSGKCPSGTAWTDVEFDIPFMGAAAAGVATGTRGRTPGR